MSRPPDQLPESKGGKTAVREVLESLGGKPRKPDPLTAAREKYDAAKLKLERGDLSKVPAASPPGVESAHAAVQSARQGLVADPKTLQDCARAAKALEVLAGKVADYLKAEAKVLQALKKKYDSAKADIDKALKGLPATAPTGLTAAFDAVTQAQARLPADPRTIAAYVDGIKALPAFKTAVVDCAKAVARKANVDAGMSRFSSAGTELNKLKGSDTLNAEQKRILDDVLKIQLGKMDQPMSDSELKKFAQTVVDKTNRLAETPLEKVPKGSKTIKKGLKGINEKLAKSPTLKTNIVKLQQDQWVIKLNEPGGGSYCDKVNKTIAIDPDDPLDEALGGLAHETGHALFTPPPKPTVASVANGLEYVRKATEVDFIDEGEAQLVACRTAKEHAAQGVSSDVPADASGKFMAIYEKLEKGEIDEATARQDMAKEFGGLVTSTTHEDYKTYYGRFHIDTWNSAHAADPTQQLTYADLNGLTLFP
ncbi:MAG TPA: hypothetical protein VIN03_07020 [Roseateles sp.]